MNIRSERTRRRTRPPRLRGLSLNRLLPNMLTMLALCAGVTAMRFAIQGRFEAAVVSIMVAAVLDALDGRIARMLNGQSKFGAARFVNGFLDLLSAAVISTSALKPLHVFGRIGLLFLVVGAVANRMVAVLWVIAVLANLTAIQRVVYTYVELKKGWTRVS